ncbi:thioesterase domain-containing protein, partial [Paraburkholderia aspalathi]|uniref:thioesterase domain-containing protein n=1 Tax=Paraburkholderia aspalathi TaxID=1324617 RepID=UPI0038BB5F0A
LLSMASRLADRGIQVNFSEVFRRPILAQLAAAIEWREHLNAFTQAGGVEVRAQGTSTPLFLMHETSGFDFYFPVLAKLIDPKLSIYGLAGVPTHQQPLHSIQEQAHRMVNMVRLIQPQGPYKVAGWSSGGVLAYEVAIQLHSQGASIEFVGLLDTYAPQVFSEKTVIPVQFSPQQYLLNFLRETSADAASLLSLQNLIDSDGSLSFDDLFARCLALKLIPEHLMGLSGHDAYLYLERMNRHEQSLQSYEPAIASFTVHIFVAEEDIPEGGDSANGSHLGWDGLIPNNRLKIVYVPGNHQSIMEEHLACLGKAITSALGCP